MRRLELFVLCLNMETHWVFKMKLLNRFNYVPDLPHHFEYTEGETETVPDQSYTISEIITRFTGGIMPSIGKQIRYDEDPTFDSHDLNARPDYDLVDAFQDMKELSDRFLEERDKYLESLKKQSSPDNESTPKEPPVITPTSV